MRRLSIVLLLGALGGASAPPPRSSAVSIGFPPERSTLPIEALEAALGSDDARMRLAAAWELAGARVSEATLARLKEMRVGDLDEKVRLAAAWAVGRQPSSPSSKNVEDDETLPSILKQPRPVYPSDAATQRIQGKVVLDILIDEHGSVAHAEIRETIPALEAAALENVRAWVFEPARHEGRPVPLRVTVEVKFRLAR